ncbi:MAG: hypothetical protein HC822_14530 [Oscillochloris sp.]|nr:hypothetical protein [Oscillochloris sp.]
MNAGTLDPQFHRLIAHLHRALGDVYGYYWRKGNGSVWWNGDGPPRLPAAQDIYFGIHPARVAGSRATRARLADIAALNCLYAEFDAKDFGGDKAAALTHIHTLPLLPSVIIDRGGGYHCYWLLDRPYALDTAAERDTARSLQMRWVDFVGGDTGAKDLTRVLRVPGTLNGKYSPPRPVCWLRCDLSLVYDLGELAARLPTAPAPAAPAPVRPLPVAPTGRRSAQDAIAAFNAEHPIGTLLERYGATRTRDGYGCACGEPHTHETQIAITRDGYAVFYSPRCRWAPQRTDRNGRPIADSFVIYTLIEHRGDTTAALKAINPWSGTRRSASFPPPPNDADRAQPSPDARRQADAARKRHSRRTDAAAIRQDVITRADADPLMSPCDRAVLDTLIDIAGDRAWCRPSRRSWRNAPATASAVYGERSAG